MKLTIITPFSRKSEYLNTINDDLGKLSDVLNITWFIIYQHNLENEIEEWNIKSNKYDNLTVCTVKGSTEKSYYGNSYRNQGIKLSEEDKDNWVYFIDDDNTIHPNFTDVLEILKDIKEDVLFFGQINPDQTIRLQPTQIKVGNVDTAMFIVRSNVMKKYEWKEEHYTADGILSEEMYENESCKIVYTPYSFYNYQHSIKFNDKIRPKKRILAYMDFDSHTGFATVAHNVIERLIPWLIENNIQLDVAALNYGDKPHRRFHDNIMIINPFYFADNYDDYYFRDSILKLLSYYDYDLYWVMNDVPVIGPMAEHIKQLQAKKQFMNRVAPISILYTPIDSVPYVRYFKHLDLFDNIVTYTNYAKEQSINAYNKANRTDNKKIMFDIIGHGTDLDTFKLLNNKEQLREKYDFPKDAFIFGSFNTNSPRKDFGTLLIAYSYFKKNHPDIKSILYLHTDPDAEDGIKLHIACERLGFEYKKDVLFPMTNAKGLKKYTKYELNELYNTLDCFATTTTAEGWGLTVTEAMSVGLPIICGNHTSLTEITNNGELVYIVNELYDHIQLKDGENIRTVLDPKAVYQQMLNVYNDTKSNTVKNNYTEKLKEFSWDTIAKQWQDKFSKYLNISYRD
jgi:glycosyltransferase involved in cell wall biosynthesis